MIPQNLLDVMESISDFIDDDDIIEEEEEEEEDCILLCRQGL